MSKHFWNRMKFVDCQNQKSISRHSSVTEASFPGFFPAACSVLALLGAGDTQKNRRRPSPRELTVLQGR